MTLYTKLFKYTYGNNPEHRHYYECTDEKRPSKYRDKHEFEVPDYILRAVRGDFPEDKPQEVPDYFRDDSDEN